QRVGDIIGGGEGGHGRVHTEAHVQPALAQGAVAGGRAAVRAARAQPERHGRAIHHLALPPSVEPRGRGGEIRFETQGVDHGWPFSERGFPKLHGGRWLGSAAGVFGSGLDYLQFSAGASGIVTAGQRGRNRFNPEDAKNRGGKTEQV